MHLILLIIRKNTDVKWNECDDWLNKMKRKSWLANKDDEREKKNNYQGKTQTNPNFSCTGANYVFSERLKKTLISELSKVFEKLQASFSNASQWYPWDSTNNSKKTSEKKPPMLVHVSSRYSMTFLIND